ncbi:MAG: hypothetical protein QM765_34325 [Myxococcales bacterium]
MRTPLSALAAATLLCLSTSARATDCYGDSECDCNEICDTSYEPYKCAAAGLRAVGESCLGTGVCAQGGVCCSGCVDANQSDSCVSGWTACAPQACQTANTCLNHACRYGQKGHGTACPGGVCTGAPGCTPGCFISGTFRSPGEINPVNPCQSCQPAVTTSDWSPTNEGLPMTCAAGRICHLGTCTAGCNISGFVPEGAANGPCQTCQPLVSLTSYSPANEALHSSCTQNNYCHSGSCQLGCSIGGAFYADQTANGSCQRCMATTSSVAWTNVNEALKSSCGTGSWCHNGSCASGCSIGGLFYADQAANGPCQVCNAGNTSWTNINQGQSCGSGQYCNAGVCGVGCSIGGTVYGNGSLNPGNPCQSCQPAISTTAWTNNADSSSCGGTKVCYAGSCGDGCVISGQFYATGTANPSNACQVCQPSTAVTSWTTLSEGTSCGGGLICHVGTCVSGCSIAGAFHTPGELMPTDACQACQPTVNTGAWTLRAEGSSCGAGRVCHSNSCVTGCYVGGAYRAAGDKNASNACESCAPATSTSAWTVAAEGDTSSCGGAQVCHQGACASGCYIGSQYRAAGTAQPGNLCLSCQPAVSLTAWSPASEFASCGTGQICHAGACATGCVINGSTYYDKDALAPGNSCLSCQPSVSTASWTPANEQSSCNTGQICHGGGCVAGCAIGGGYWAAGALNTANACQQCVPAASTTVWTTLADTASCGGGKFCSSGACSTGCVVLGAFYAGGALSPGNACQVCDPSTRTDAFTPLSDGAACGAQVCNGGKCGTGCYIASTSYPSGAANPGNACQICDPSKSISAWTDSPEGLQCGTGLVCHAQVCSAGCFISNAYYAAAALNPASSCQSCVPAVSTTGWSSTPDGTGCGTGRICAGGQCLQDCYVGGTTYSAGQDNPADACEACDPAVSTSSFSPAHEGTSCAAGKVCRNGDCQAGCSIAGAYYGPGAANPANGCQQCLPDQSLSAWVNADGASCAAGKVCTGGACATGCFVAGTFVAAGSLDPANACMRCDPTLATGAWSPGDDGVGCGSGQVCTAGQCKAGCYIDGAFRDAGSTNPSNICQACSAATSTVAWSKQPEGADCGAGRACTNGVCSGMCTIGGKTFADQQQDPTEACRKCDSATKADDWTPRADGLDCGGGKLCHAGQCSVGCLIAGAFYPDGALKDQDSCHSCQAARTPTAWTDAKAGDPCLSDGNECTADVCDAQLACQHRPLDEGTGCGKAPADEVSTRFCFDGACKSGCLIGGVAYKPGARKGLAGDDSCQICSPSTNATGWSAPDSDGLVPCGTSVNCVSGDCRCSINTCDTSGVCRGVAAQPGTPCGLNGEGCVGQRCECGRGTAEASCTDGVDNDCNGKVDCEDEGCLASRCAPADLCVDRESAKCQTVEGKGVCVGTPVDCSGEAPPPCRKPRTCDPESGKCVATELVEAGTACENASGCRGTCDVQGNCNAECNKADDSRTLFACGCGSVAGGAPAALVLLSLALLRRRRGRSRAGLAALLLALALVGSASGTAEAAAKKKVFKAGPNATPGQILALAHKALDAQDWAAAAELAGRALASEALEEPKKFDALTVQACALSVSSDEATATAAFKKLLALDPELGLMATAPQQAVDLLRRLRGELAAEASAKAKLEAEAAAKAKAAEEARAKARASKKKIAVLTLKAGPELDPKTAELLTDMLSDAIQRRPGMQVTSSKDIESSLGFERQKQLLGCSDATCLAEVGGALGVDKLVTGTLGKLGNSAVLSVQLLDAKKSVVDRRFSARAKSASSEAFLDILGPVVEGLFGDSPPSTEMYVAEAASAEVPRKAPFVIVKARGQVQLTDAGFAGAGAAIVGLQPVAPLRISVGGLFAMARQGMLLNVSAIPVNAEGSIYPVLGVEVPLFFNDPISAGVGANVGVEWAPIQNFAVGLEVPVYYFFAAPYGKLRWNAFVAGSASVRF